MDLFTFASWVLVVVAAVTVLWPLNVPLLAVACKLRVAWGKLDYEPGEFWWRCIFGSLGLAAMTLVMLGLAYLIIVGAELQQSRGIVHLVLILIYLPAAVGFLFWVLALEDLVQALSVFLIYLLVPGLPVFLIGWLLGLWRAVAQNAPWLLSPS